MAWGHHNGPDRIFYNFIKKQIPKMTSYRLTDWTSRQFRHQLLAGLILNFLQCNSILKHPIGFICDPTGTQWLTRVSWPENHGNIPWPAFPLFPFHSVSLPFPLCLSLTPSLLIPLPLSFSNYLTHSLPVVSFPNAVRILLSVIRSNVSKSMSNTNTLHGPPVISLHSPFPISHPGLGISLLCHTVIRTS